jgi:hypothetical protein
MRKQLSAYVDVDGRSDASVQAPGIFLNTRTWTFGAYGNRARIQDLAEHLIDKPTGGEVTAMVPTRLALFIFANADRLYSPNPPMGWTPNHEFIIASPVILRVKRERRPRLGLLPSWVYIDNYRGMVTGRESWGYFKNLGEVTAPKAWSTPFLCALDTLVFDPASNNTEGVTARLVQVNSVSHLGPTTIPGEQREAISYLHRLLRSHVEKDALSLFDDAAGLLGKLSIPAFNLKQLRDTVDGTKACYQAITTSPLQVKHLKHLATLPEDCTVSTLNVASAQIAQVLGLGASPLDVKFGLSADIDYQAIPGEVLWETP